MVVELVWDYGVDRTFRMIRQHPTPARARAALEAERQRNQEYRWTTAKGACQPVIESV